MFRACAAHGNVRRADDPLFGQFRRSLFDERADGASAEAAAQFRVPVFPILAQKGERRRLRLCARGGFKSAVFEQNVRFIKFAHGALAHFSGQKQPQYERFRAAVAHRDLLREGKALRTEGGHLVHDGKNAFQFCRIEIAVPLQSHDEAVDDPVAEGHFDSAPLANAVDRAIFEYAVHLAVRDVDNHFRRHFLSLKNRMPRSRPEAIEKYFRPKGGKISPSSSSGCRFRSHGTQGRSLSRCRATL